MAGTTAKSVRGTAPDVPGAKLRMTALAAMGVSGRNRFSVMMNAYATAVDDGMLIVVVCSASTVAVLASVCAPEVCIRTTLTSAWLGPGLNTFTSTVAPDGRKGIISSFESSDG